MANLRTLRTKSNESNDSGGVIRVTDISRQMDKDTNEFVNRTKATAKAGSFFSFSFWGLCIMVSILSHFGDKRGDPKRPADVLFVSHQKCSCWMEFV